MEIWKLTSKVLPCTYFVNTNSEIWVLRNCGCMQTDNTQKEKFNICFLFIRLENVWKNKKSLYDPPEYKTTAYSTVVTIRTIYFNITEPLILPPDCILAFRLIFSITSNFSLKNTHLNDWCLSRRGKTVTEKHELNFLNSSDIYSSLVRVRNWKLNNHNTRNIRIIFTTTSEIAWINVPTYD